MLPYIVDLVPKQNEKPGKLIAIEKGTIGFDVKRVFYIYGFSDDIENTTRGNHGHTNSTQLLVCLAGSVDIETQFTDGTQLKFHLNNNQSGLMLLPNNIVVMKRFTKDAILMVVCDNEFKDEITFTKDPYQICE